MISLPTFKANKLQVNGFAVLMGWLISYVLGGFVYVFARQSPLLPLIFDLDVIDARFFGPAAFSANWWLLASMAWLFVIWGAFRCAKIAREKALGSTIVLWVGPELLSWPITIEAGFNLNFFYDIIGSGLLCFAGYFLAHSSTKHASH